jgi:hypothetical protein
MKTKQLLTPILSILTAVTLVSQPAGVHAAPPAPATTAVSTNSGLTKVTLDPSLLSALDTLGVKLSKLAPATLLAPKKGIVGFPIVGGIFDPGAGSGEITHRGGLVLCAGETQVVLSDFLIELPTASDPVLTGLVTVDGGYVGRVPLFAVDLAGASIKQKRWVFNVSNVALTLTADAAVALNTIFGVTAFTEGAAVGKAHVCAYTRALPKCAPVKPPTKPKDDDKDDKDDDDGDED